MKRKIIVFGALISLACVALLPGLATAQVRSVTSGFEVGLSDSFNSARNADPHYGLNDNLGDRQAGSMRGTTYTQVPGLWYDGDMTNNSLRPWHSQVNHSYHRDSLSFHARTSAVRLDKALPTAEIKVSAILTPAVGSNNRNEWASTSLATSAHSRGYVSDSQTMLGLLISSAGKIQVFQYGSLLGVGQIMSIPQDGKYAVAWSVSGNKVQVTVNGKLFSFTLRQSLPKTAWLFLGRYSDDATIVSRIDNLKISAKTTALATINKSSLRYFGYFASRIENIPKVDWVAFNQYCVPVTTLEQSLNKLESLTVDRPDIKLFMYVDSARDISCGSTKTDAQLADLQWQQFAMAQRHPRLAGLLAFSLWTHEPSMSPLPKTIDAQQRIAAKIIYGN